MSRGQRPLQLLMLGQRENVSCAASRQRWTTNKKYIPPTYKNMVISVLIFSVKVKMYAFLLPTKETCQRNTEIPDPGFMNLLC